MRSPASFIGISSAFTATGPATGTVSGQTLTFAFTVTFAAPFQFCTASANGTAQITSVSLTGRYTGTNSCSGGPFTNGQFTLARQ